MGSIAQLKLKENEKKALQELKERILQNFPDAEIILYGSKARGDFDEESDIDLLILLNCPPEDWQAGDVSPQSEREIRDISFDLELKHEVIFNILVESKEYWNSSLANAMPIHWNIDKEGINV